MLGPRAGSLLVLVLLAAPAFGWHVRDRNHDGVTTIACLGDSNTDQLPGVENWCTQLAAMAPPLQVRGPWRTVNYGKAGARVINDGAGQVQQALDGLVPDAAVLAFGTNDVGYLFPTDSILQAYLAQALALRRAHVDVLIATTPPVRCGRDPARIADLNVALHRAVPRRHLVDFTTGFDDPDLFEDCVHFATNGQALRAQRVWDRLGGVR